MGNADDKGQFRGFYLNISYSKKWQKLKKSPNVALVCNRY